VAKVTIREYEHTTHTARGLVSVGEEPALVIQKTASLPFTSATFNVRTKMIRISTDVAIAFAVGVIPVASSTAPDMSAGQTEYFGVVQSAGHSINVVAT